MVLVCDRVISVKTWEQFERDIPLRFQSQDVIDFPQSSITSIQSQDLRCPKFAQRTKVLGNPSHIQVAGVRMLGEPWKALKVTCESGMVACKKLTKRIPTGSHR